ncbi:sigma 54-interacting transcriptional regulator, partial [Achromobacter xylosoxidans]
HAKGAFSGALTERPGRFEAANGGTLFLDEVGELPLAVQAKLLRTLQNGEIQRLGDDRPRTVDVRIV